MNPRQHWDLAPTHDRVLDENFRKLKERLGYREDAFSLGPLATLLRGQAFSGIVVPGTGAEVEVRHALGRVPAGIVVAFCTSSIASPDLLVGFVDGGGPPGNATAWTDAKLYVAQRSATGADETFSFVVI